MSLLSLALCVCDAEAIYGMLVWPRCEDAPPDSALLHRAASSHGVFDVCPAVPPVPKQAATSSFVLLVSVCVCVCFERGCAAFGREPLCAGAGACVLTLSVRVCACPASRPAAPLCPIPLSCPPSCRGKPDLGHWGQRTGCGTQWVSTECTWLE